LANSLFSSVDQNHPVCHTEANGHEDHLCDPVKGFALLDSEDGVGVLGAQHKILNQAQHAETDRHELFEPLGMTCLAICDRAELLELLTILISHDECFVIDLHHLFTAVGLTYNHRSSWFIDQIR